MHHFIALEIKTPVGSRRNMGFRKLGRKLDVKLIDAYIYHYGWVKHPQQQQHKRENVGVYYSNSHQSSFKNDTEELFDYGNDADSLQRFEGTHPSVMKKRIEEKNWDLQLDVSRKNMSLKDAMLYKIEKWTGKRLFDYQNYRII